jgi:co-chaperonin GroES (HSP10)
MKINPVGKKILVKPSKIDDEVIGSVILPGVANAKLSRGVVVEVSDELSSLYKSKDIILFPEKSGVGQFYNGQPHLWLRSDEIWGIVEEQ